MSRVTVEGISKRYRMGRRLPTLRETLARALRKSDVEHHWALRDVSFELGQGEALGIIGPNGAGKTTMLRILSRVTRPTEGRVHVDGRVAALLELGAGFHPELTGRENIYLNGTILGMRRREIRARFDEMCEFAGIGSYLDTPVKRYSSGMHVRLGFAVAAHLEPEVFLVDEVLAVGDFAFQQKCQARMEELRARGTSLIFVSHNLEAVRRVCDRGLVLYGGRKIFEGSAVDAVLRYSDAVREAAKRTVPLVPPSGGLAERVMTFDAEIERVALLGEGGCPATSVPTGARVVVEMDVRFHRPVREPVFGLSIRTSNGHWVYTTTTRLLGMRTPHFSAGERCRVRCALEMGLLEGVYEIAADVTAADWTHYYDRRERALEFHVTGRPEARGLVDLRGEIALETLPGATDSSDGAKTQVRVD